MHHRIPAVTVWNSLKVVLARLLDEQPGALTSFPDPRVDQGRRPPFSIGLAAWATSAAEELHRTFGTDVDLTVGAQPYPSGSRPRSLGGRLNIPPPAAPDQVGIELDGPLTVRAGHTARHGLLVTNRTGTDLAISTNGQLTAVVVDPGTDRVVGGFAGAQHMPLVVFRVPAGETRRIPLLVGTTSFEPSLGYAIPPGDWAVRTTLRLGDGRTLGTPTMPLTVTG